MTRDGLKEQIRGATSGTALALYLAVLITAVVILAATMRP